MCVCVCCVCRVRYVCSKYKDSMYMYYSMPVSVNVSASVCPFIAPCLSCTVCGHRFSPGWYCGSVAVK